MPNPPTPAASGQESLHGYMTQGNLLLLLAVTSGIAFVVLFAKHCLPAKHRYDEH